jgi:LytS/YehU family sensor histidine kinase
MEDRLRFVIDASEEARAAVLPTLLLQPLVENAVQHGLEPKVEGGTVHIIVRVNAGRLEIDVDDDGLGLDTPIRSRNRGNGMAISNIRERLQTRYGQGATLTLMMRPTGTRASLNLPYATLP